MNNSFVISISEALFKTDVVLVSREQSPNKRIGFAFDLHLILVALFFPSSVDIESQTE